MPEATYECGVELGSGSGPLGLSLIISTLRGGLGSESGVLSRAHIQASPWEAAGRSLSLSSPGAVPGVSHRSVTAPACFMTKADYTKGH